MPVLFLLAIAWQSSGAVSPNGTFPAAIASWPEPSPGIVMVVGLGLVLVSFLLKKLPHR
ncbi:MAG: hypothetical protein P4L56_21325 [Candidatus Sulfopaludibacter sp.]|nr:hypothetical protein [Candidatus Sulfopaludibacter sp.]